MFCEHIAQMYSCFVSSVLHFDQCHDSRHKTHKLHIRSCSLLILNLNAIMVLQVATGQADEVKKSQEEVIKLQVDTSTSKAQRAQKGTYRSSDSFIKAHLPQPQVHQPMCCLRPIVDVGKQIGLLPANCCSSSAWQ